MEPMSAVLVQEALLPPAQSCGLAAPSCGLSWPRLPKLWIEKPYPVWLAQAKAMIELARLVRRVAPTSVPVLILGETGVGKERVADAVHQLSGRRWSLHPHQLWGFSPELVGAELFGAVRGAYTGADRDRVGAFAAANGGTLFFDELVSCRLPFRFSCCGSRVGDDPAARRCARASGRRTGRGGDAS